MYEGKMRETFYWTSKEIQFTSITMYEKAEKRITAIST
jgi:hypothetical protein